MSVSHYDAMRRRTGLASCGSSASGSDHDAADARPAGASGAAQTSSLGGSEMQPFVGCPSSAWMKIADPRPGTAGAELYSMKARWA